MTRMINVTEIRELTRVKVVCACGYSVEVPTNAFSGIEPACPLCAKRLPVNGIFELNKAIFNLSDGIKKMDGVKVVFETEKEV